MNERTNERTNEVNVFVNSPREDKNYFGGVFEFLTPKTPALPYGLMLWLELPRSTIASYISENTIKQTL